MARNKSRKWQWHETAKEVRFIQSVNPANPGPAFNHSTRVFQEYREMQARHAVYSGQQDHAEQMLMLGAWHRPASYN